MAEPTLYEYPSPLDGYRGLPALNQERVADGPDKKSYINDQSAPRSTAYTAFASPITNGTRGGFDAHIYYNPQDERERVFATELHERIRREFPELRIYPMLDRPVGPHPVAMFEVNLFTPEQFGAFVAWLVIHRGPLSALLHPNTGDDVRDHTQRATWMGQPYPLLVSALKAFTAAQQTA